MPLLHRLLGCIAAAAALAAAACGDGGRTELTDPPAGVERLAVEVVGSVPVDPEAFTQGLELREEVLYLTSGLYGRSWVRALDRDGRIIAETRLDDDLFAEGLTVVGDELVVLTWKEGTVLVLDASTLEERRRIHHDDETWGVCFDGEHLVVSDGTAELAFRDPLDFSIRGRVEVRLGDAPLESLNELECVDGSVWANVWLTETIVRIDPATGRVTAVVDAEPLIPPDATDDPNAVLNGIAHDPERGTFLLTGKLWGIVHEVRLVAAGSQR